MDHADPGRIRRRWQPGARWRGCAQRRRGGGADGRRTPRRSAARATRSSAGCSTWSRRWRSPPGAPVPRVYVHGRPSPAINAFAAGHSLNDAVIAVTRGTLDAAQPRRAAGRDRATSSATS
ncbi:MAG: hypothetical protein MZU91_01240 [Desulfosudis oleivorans]|nr:hypothetical protein [Desulfosudis oleivorans]